MSTHFFRSEQDFLRQGSDDLSGQCLRHDPENKDDRGKKGHGDSRKEVRPVSSGGAFGLFINEDHLKDDQVIIERDEAAEERDCHQPEQTVISSSAERCAEQVEFSKKSRQRRQASEG